MKKKKSFISMKISRSCVTISHLYPRFDFFQTWYFVIKNTHQLRDPSKRSKVKILYLSRLATLNFSWSTMHLWWSLTIHRIVIDAPKTIKSTFSILSILFFSRLSFSHESSSPFRTFSNQFLPRLSLHHQLESYFICDKTVSLSSYIQEEFPDGEYRSSIFPLQM